MRRIVARRIFEYFRPYYSDKVHPEYRKQVYYSGRRIFNKVTWLLVFLAMCTWLGFLEPHVHAAELAVLIGVTTSYVRLRKRARGLAVRRRVPEHATQGELIEVHLDVTNGSRHPIRDLVLKDSFSGATDPQAALWIDEWILPGRVWRGSYKKRCDAGMGLHSFTGLSVALMDPLGIFDFSVEEDARAELSIYPGPVPIPELPITGQRESFSHGKYDTRSRSGSTNFAGLRGYTRGDSLRCVSWKASARLGKLMVKEFEAVANTDVTIVLDMSSARHAGTDSESSWEQAKDAALSILAQQLANGNRVGLFSQEAYVPPGGGEAHMNLIAQSIFRLRPIEDPPGQSNLERLFGLISAGTTVVYIGGVLADGNARTAHRPGVGIAGGFSAIRGQLTRLSIKNVQTICLLIDSASYVDRVDLSGLDGVAIAGLQATAARTSEEGRSLAMGGIRAFILERGRTVGEALLAR